MSIDDDLWFTTCQRLRARVSPRPANVQPGCTVTLDADDADDLSWFLAEAIKLPGVRYRLRQAEAHLEAARAAFAAAKGKGKRRPTTADRAAAACRALGLIRTGKRGVTRDRAAILHDWDSLRAVRALRGVVVEPPRPVSEVIAEITRRHGFKTEAACIKYLRRLRATMDEPYRWLLDDLPGDPTDE